MARRKPLQERFWAKVQKGPGCWEWTASTFTSGYGCFMLRHGHPVGAHRMAWELTHGPIPEGLQALHTCDNRRCCRPEHLYLGSNDDNMRDRDRRGRGFRPQGETNGQHKLTVEEIEEIRRLYCETDATQSELAARYGVSQANISLIVRARSWAHV